MIDYLPIKLYKKPDGRVQIIECRNVHLQDLKYFQDNEIVVSMEELDANNYIVYGCPAADLSEESEMIVFSNGRSCEETLEDLAFECIQEFGDVNV